MEKIKKYEIEVNLHLLIDADEKGTAIANADILLLKLSNNLIASNIVNVKEINL